MYRRSFPAWFVGQGFSPLLLASRSMRVLAGMKSKAVDFWATKHKSLESPSASFRL